ncbi:MAG: NADP-dependent malic enzyme [Proteobacteria bacterium]|nr:NADP-dependent malic enzyme [Pseudomonadota bacterium]
MSNREAALAYHSRGRPGKIEIRCTKPTATQRDLSLAYTPGVAEPCLDIAELPERVNEYTARGNLVAVVSNGSAVLGLGNIGPRAGKPVMEGKAVLFKRFADIDVFDLEIDAPTVEEFIETTRRLEPTFGGINLEDVKAPECFEIEPALEEAMDIPVFHDDQHGTAIISGAALLNACELAGKDPAQCLMVISGAGASAISGARLYEALGFRHENILLCDTKGYIYEGRENVNKYKAPYAHPDDGRRTLTDVVKDADILIGLSVAGAFKPDMIRAMARDPIVFALSNPWPEILPEEAHAVRDDLIMGTGRSDFPNQINNVLGFPFIFRGALDTRARSISREMMVAAARSLAALAREDVPESVSRAYGGERFHFGRDYLIPKPFDPRVLVWESHAVAKAAVESGVARRALDLDQYREELAQRLDLTRTFVSLAQRKSRTQRPWAVFPESLNEKVLRAVQELGEQRVAHCMLLGNPVTVNKRARDLGVKIPEAKIVEPRTLEGLDELVDIYRKTLGRDGDPVIARQNIINDPLLCAILLLEAGRVSALVAGAETAYPQAARKVLRIVGTAEGYRHAAGMHIVRLRDRTLFFADTTLNIAPDAETLAGIAIATANAARRFEVEPVVAMLSFSNFGESDHPEARKVAEAVKIVRVRAPNLPVIGEIQADWAVSPNDFEELIPKDRRLGRPANVLVFPTLGAANIAFRLARVLADGDVIGPVILGLRRAVGLLPRGASVAEIVRMTSICGLEALGKGESKAS